MNRADMLTDMATIILRCDKDTNTVSQVDRTNITKPGENAAILPYYNTTFLQINTDPSRARSVNCLQELTAPPLPRGRRDRGPGGQAGGGPPFVLLMTDRRTA